MPPPIRLGRLARWSIAEIDAWILAGAPDAAAWQARKGAPRP
jgi:predicted DNA-binding transcriptional regulator AlpA